MTVWRRRCESHACIDDRDTGRGTVELRTSADPERTIEATEEELDAWASAWLRRHTGEPG